VIRVPTLQRSLDLQGTLKFEKGLRRRKAEATGRQCESGKSKKIANLNTIILM
jgi:hypothetical protein